MPDRITPVWNIRESKQARMQLDALADNPRFDEVWAAVRWLIIRDPTSAGRPVPGKQRTYTLKTNDFLAIGLPVILITYSLIDDENRVLEIVSVIHAAPVVKDEKVATVTGMPKGKAIV